jgi:hypothetical protein
MEHISRKAQRHTLEATIHTDGCSTEEMSMDKGRTAYGLQTSTSMVLMGLRRLNQSAKGRKH